MDAHLDQLESDSIFVLREARARIPRLAVLWSMGKDSSVLLWLVRRAFLGRVPFPVVHIDTSYKMPEMIAFRDRLAREWDLPLMVARNDAALAARETFPDGTRTRVACCSALKKDALARVVEAEGFGGVIVGVRRDEEPTRAKERYFSPRGVDMTWDVQRQPPEFWDQFATDPPDRGHVRVHPLLHWTELNVWQYIRRHHLPVPSLYFDQGDGQRYRSLGCGPCTSPTASTARTIDDIVTELKERTVAERAGRAQDAESEAAFELLRRDGYM